MQEISISNYFVTAVLKNVSRHGLDINKLLARAGISRRLFCEPESRVTTEQFATLQSIVMREMNDEMLGYAPKPLKIGTWSLQCHWLIHSRNLGQALKRFCLFYAAIDRGISVKLSADGLVRKLMFRVDEEQGGVSAYSYELFMFCFHRFTCWLIEDNLPIQKVWLNYPLPEHQQEYRVLFPRTECVFEQTECAIFIDRALMDMPITQTPESLADFLKQPLLNILINDYYHQSWTTKVQAILRENLEELPTLVEVAEILSIHPKKLCRYLEGEGIGYVDLKNQLRRDIAIRCLVETSDPIEKISSHTGFSEASTFIRAFKKWTGVTPHTYRKCARK